jgi:hypothetical protein
MGYTLAESVQMCALASVLRKDEAYLVRHIFRWYSKTFATPLHVVPDLPFEDVLQAYYEHEYETMQPDELTEAAERLIETDEERAQREREKDTEEAENFEFDKMTAEQERKKKARKKKPTTMDSIGSAEGGLLGSDIIGPMPSVDHLPLRSTPQPEVKVKFMADERIAGILAQDERDQ